MTAFYAWLARMSLRHRWWFLGAWVVILVLAASGAARAEHVLKVGSLSVPGTDSYTASLILRRDFDIDADKAGIVIFHSDTLRVTDKPFADAVEQASEKLSGEKVVTSVTSFFSSGVPELVSPDNHTTFAFIAFEGGEKELQEVVPRLRDHIRSDVLETSLIGRVANNLDIQTASAEDLARVERITFPLVFVLLVLVFGSLVAAFIPLVLGAAGVLVSLAVLYLLALVSDVSIFALNTASMIGLGLAIDFSLMMVSRFREEMARQPLEQALESMLQTAGRSITYSGLTLMLTMAVLTLFPVMIIRSIATAITIVAGVAVLTALLLLPALLAVLGKRVNSLDLRRFIPGLNHSRAGIWERWAHAVMRRPWISMVIALLILGIMALPVLQLERRGITIGVLPKQNETRRAFELAQRQFGAGVIAPLYVVVETDRPGGVWQPAILEGVYQLHSRLEADPRVARVQSLASLKPNPSAEWIRSLSPATINAIPDLKRFAERLANLDGENTTTLLTVFPRADEASRETRGLMLDLRAQAKSWAPGLQQAQVLIGGAPGLYYDFDRFVYDQFPLLLGLSLLVTFVILMLFFHSLILPLKAILLNLASLVASYGILVLVFQMGVGDELLRFDSPGAILNFTPVLLFSILFGLSTDYEVFLLTRVREYYRHGHSNEESVALGLEHTAGIITAAGLIMIVVFGSFAMTGVLPIKELGFGLAVAVLLDTTLVRMVLVPASMKLMGDLNWWMPAALDRLVPEIEEGGVPPTQPHPVPAPVAQH